MSDKEYDINCNFVIDLDIDKLEDNTHKNMSLKGNEFYIKNTKLLETNLQLTNFFEIKKEGVWSDTPNPKM